MPHCELIWEIPVNNKNITAMNKALFVLGILSVLTSAILMVLDVLPLGARITILIVGIGLILTSRKARKS